VNPAQYVDVSKKIEPISNIENIDIMWKFIEEKLTEVEIHLNKILVAVLAPNAKPGWSLLAIKDGPLAKSIKGGSTPDPVPSLDY
jgi:hypothetical protein